MCYEETPKAALCEDDEAETEKRAESGAPKAEETREKQEKDRGRVSFYAGLAQTYGKVHKVVCDAGDAVRGAAQRGVKRVRYSPYMRARRFLNTLPYVDRENAGEMLNAFLKEPEAVLRTDIATAMEYLCPEDCDRLFERYVLFGGRNYRFKRIGRYLTPACVRRIAEHYILRERIYPHIEELYPYLSAEDVRRIYANM